MLGKLMKYEIKATGRSLFPLYGALLIFALINRMFFGRGYNGEMIELMDGIPFAVSISVYICTMMAVFVVTFFIIVQRFYQNLLGDEGYLMHTLPVKPWQNVLSKLLVATLWSIVSGMVSVASGLVLASSKELWPILWKGILDGTQWFFLTNGASGYLIVAEVIILSVLVCFVGIMQLYASISLGHLASKHRVLTSFGAFLLITCIMSMIGAFIGHAVGGVNHYSNSMAMYGDAATTILNANFWLSIAENMIAFGVLFAVTHVVLAKRLNLE